MARSDITHLQPATPPSSLREWLLAALVVALPILVVNWAFAPSDTGVAGRIHVSSQPYYAGPLVEHTPTPPRHSANGAFSGGLSAGSEDNLVMIPAPVNSLQDGGEQPVSLSSLNGLPNTGRSYADTGPGTVRLLVQTPHSELGPSLITLPQTAKSVAPVTPQTEKDPYGRPANLVAASTAQEAAASARHEARRRRYVNAEPRDFVSDPPYPIPDYVSEYRQSRANIQHDTYAIAPPKTDQRTVAIVSGYGALSGKAPESPMDGWKSVGVDPWGRTPPDASRPGAESTYGRDSSSRY